MQKSRIAVLLPAGKLFDRIFADAIVPANLGDLKRLSTELSDSKLPSTLNAIKSSATVIADLSAHNPHIMFLTGYARALEKPITYLAQHAEDFPFAKSTHPIIYNSDLNFLRTELVAQFSGQRTAHNNGADDPRAKFLSTFGDLLQKHAHEHRGPILQDEPNVFTLLEQDMDLALVQDIARRGRELGIRVRLM